ncbi:DUF5375 family protein, partial [Yersinia frederiksenii]
GPEAGMDMACTMLSDMVQPDILLAPPRLTVLGQKMMDELCQAQITTTSQTTLH